MVKVISVFLFLFTTYSYASMPVAVTMTGCVMDGRFTTEGTDYGTHKVEHPYVIKVIDRDSNKPIELKDYNGKRISIKGYLHPSDLLFTDKNSIKLIGDCEQGQKKKLTIEEQEKLAREIFQQLAKTDSDRTDVVIKLYQRVIDECPDTERAQEAYWRLSNLYLQAYEQPQYDKIVTLLEEAIKRYPNTQATPHYKQRLLRAYEETKQWQKAVDLYEEALKTNPEILSDPQNTATMLSYADALIGAGQKAKAREILQRVISFGDRIENWLLEIAREKLEGVKE